MSLQVDGSLAALLFQRATFTPANYKRVPVGLARIAQRCAPAESRHPAHSLAAASPHADQRM